MSERSQRFPITIEQQPPRTMTLREFVHSEPPRQIRVVRTEAPRPPRDDRPVADVIMESAIREFRTLHAKFADLIDFDEMVRRAMSDE